MTRRLTVHMLRAISPRGERATACGIASGVRTTDEPDFVTCRACRRTHWFREEDGK